MAEASGTGRIDDHEIRIKRLEAARREMEDTVIVMAHLETKSSQRVKERAEFIAGHELAMREFDDKFNALIRIIGNMQGGMESHA